MDKAWHFNSYNEYKFVANFMNISCKLLPYHNICSPYELLSCHDCLVIHDLIYIACPLIDFLNQERLIFRLKHMFFKLVRFLDTLVPTNLCVMGHLVTICYAYFSNDFIPISMHPMVISSFYYFIFGCNFSLNSVTN